MNYLSQLRVQFNYTIIDDFHDTLVAENIAQTSLIQLVFYQRVNLVWVK